MQKLFVIIKEHIHRQNGNFLKEIFLKTFKVLKIINLIIKIKKISIGNCNVENLVDFTLSQNNTVKTQQKRSEIIKLLEMVKKYQPKYILEIGTLNGGTLFLFSRISSKDTLLISIDIPKGKIGGPHSRWKIYSDWRIPFLKRISLLNQKIELIRANAHKTSSLYQVKKILDNKKLDFLFIDAAHTYEGVKKIFEMYSPLVKSGGVIAFHDIVFSSGSINDVHNFWEQIKNQFDFDEFFEDSSQKTGGIGVIRK